jgi:outer membrane immunogenic protein
MKQLPLAASIFMSTLLLSSTTFAHVSMKDETLSLATTTPYNWTGVYAGLNAGAVKYTMDVTDNQASAFNATIKQVSNPRFTGGFQVGYRRQLDLTKTSGVYGLEFSMHFSNANFNQTYGSSFALYQLNSNYELQNLSLLQLMGGIAADRALLFLTGGLSWTNISGNFTSQNGAPFFTSFNVGKKALGSVFGGGIEYAVTNKISARFKMDVITPNVYTVSDNTSNSFQISNHIAQATLGVNYKFG